MKAIHVWLRFNTMKIRKVYGQRISHDCQLNDMKYDRNKTYVKRPLKNRQNKDLYDRW